MKANFLSLAVMFVLSLVSDPNRKAEVEKLLPADVVTKLNNNQIKPRTEDIYMRAQVTVAPSGTAASELMPSNSRKVIGITNLEDGNSLPKNTFFAATHVSFGYSQAAAASTADARSYSNATQTLAAGAYTQRIPVLVLNSEIEVLINGRTIYRSLIQDLCTDNNVNEDSNAKLYVPLDAPALITDQDKIVVKYYTPAGGSAVGGTITEYFDVRIHGARFVPVA